MKLTAKMVLRYELKYQSTTGFALFETHQVDVDKNKIKNTKTNFNLPAAELGIRDRPTQGRLVQRSCGAAAPPENATKKSFSKLKK